MDLFDFKLVRLGVSRSHSVRDKSTIVNAYFFRILKAEDSPVLPESIESR